MRSIHELTTAEAYQLVAKHFGHELPPLAAVENEDWGRDYVLQHFQFHSDEELAVVGLTWQPTNGEKNLNTRYGSGGPLSGCARIGVDVDGNREPVNDNRMARRKPADKADKPAKKPGLYRTVLLWVFKNKPQDPATGELPFSQADLREAATTLGVEARNFPDLTYNLRSRSPLPSEILKAGYTTIASRGRGKYALVMEVNKVDGPGDTPVVEVSSALIPDAIRDILRADEQSILSAMRYLDIVSNFVGRKAYHLQGHLRTTGSFGQQVEADDVWVAVVQGSSASRTVLPIEAKGPHERLGRHQMISTIDAVLKKIPGIPVVPLAAQLEASGLLLVIQFSYQLVAGKITAINPTRFKRYRLNPKLPLWP